MRIYRWPGGLPPEARGAAVAIGNFDGVHEGHRAVIAAAGRHARAIGAVWGVVTFEPHPREVVQPDRALPRLTPLARKAGIFRSLGVERLYVLRFSAALMALDARAFVTDVLLRDLGVRAVVAGHDFRFGHRRGGDITLLTTACTGGDVAVETVAPVEVDGTLCSSTALRGLLADGEVAKAARLLGDHYVLEGEVRPGDRRGRTIGFPTANVHPRGLRPLLPGHGVYAVRAGRRLGDAVAWYPAVANLGRRPTFGGRSVLLEVHLLEGGGDLYGERLQVAFVERLRGEHRFAGVDELRAQLARDCDAARAIHGRRAA